MLYGAAQKDSVSASVSYSLGALTAYRIEARPLFSLIRESNGGIELGLLHNSTEVKKGQLEFRSWRNIFLQLLLDSPGI